MKLKSLIGGLAAAAALGLVVGNASAVDIGEVGSYDVFVASANDINGAGAEEAWIEGILLTDVTYTQLGGESAGVNWQAVTGVGAVAGDYAYFFGAGVTPDYYLVKVGGGGGTGTTAETWLFQNVADLEWAFLNLSVFGAGVSLTNIGIISHLGLTGGTTVPEPGILALLGVGLALVGFTRRRKIA